MEELRIMLLVSAFIMFLFVIYDAAKTADDHGGACILAASICVTMMGMFSINMLLLGNKLPYILMGVAILLVVLFALILKHWTIIKRWLSQHNKNRYRRKLTRF